MGMSNRRLPELLSFGIGKLLSKLPIRWKPSGKWMTKKFTPLLILLLIGTVSFASYQNALQLAKSTAKVQQTNAVLKDLTEISSILTEVEAGRRGYILFGDREELSRYQNAGKNLQAQLDRLQSTLSDTPQQQERLNTLESSISQRLELFKNSIESYSSVRKAPQILPIAKDPYTAQIDLNRQKIRQIIAELVTEEEALLGRQVEESQRTFQFRILLEILGTMLAFAALFIVYGLLFQQSMKRQQAEASRKALEQEKELSELKLQLFSMVSHEFRTPLSLILGSAQLLGKSLQAPIDPSKLKNLQRIKSSAKTMTWMLEDILTLARSEAGKLDCNPNLVEVQTFCLNLVENFRIFSESKRTIKFVKQGSNTHAYLDEALIYSILSNLLSNALKYSSVDSTVYFTLICEPTCVTFKVKDKGIGIAPTDRSKLYDPFSRGSNVKGIWGTGLGLALVKRCVDLHRGTLSLESEVGVGSTFTVTIPQKGKIDRAINDAEVTAGVDVPKVTQEK
jgi:signal transduction histidine kinase